MNKKSSSRQKLQQAPADNVDKGKNIVESIAEKSKELAEAFNISPDWKEKVLNMVSSFPNLPNTIEDMLIYYARTIEYFELKELDPFDPRLDRVEQKLEALSGKLGLHYETSKNVQLKARQLLAYN